MSLICIALKTQKFNKKLKSALFSNIRLILPNPEFMSIIIQ